MGTHEQSTNWTPAVNVSMEKTLFLNGNIVSCHFNSIKKCTPNGWFGKLRCLIETLSLFAMCSKISSSITSEKLEKKSNLFWIALVLLIYKVTWFQVRGHSMWSLCKEIKFGLRLNIKKKKYKKKNYRQILQKRVFQQREHILLLVSGKMSVKTVT